MVDRKLLGSGTRTWRKISDGSVWPTIEHDPDLDGIEWKLRYASDSLTREDALYAASIVAAYGHLIYDANRDKVALVRRELREVQP